MILEDGGADDDHNHVVSMMMFVKKMQNGPLQYNCMQFYQHYDLNHLEYQMNAELWENLLQLLKKKI